MNLLFLIFLFRYSFSQTCPGTSPSSCNPEIPDVIQIAPGGTLDIPLSFSTSCIPSAFNLQVSAGLHINCAPTACTVTADASFTGTGWIYVGWCDLQGNPGNKNTTCQCLCSTTAPPTTTPATPTTTTTPPTTAPTAPPTSAPTTTAPTYPPSVEPYIPPAPAPAPTTPPVGCQGGPPSTCAIDIPATVTMCSCEVKTFQFTFPTNCNITSFEFSYSLSSGVFVQLLHNGTDYISVALSAAANVTGEASITIGWCDSSGGYGTRKSTCQISPTVPPTPVTLSPTPGTGGGTCAPGGPPSTCVASGPSYFKATPGQPYTFSVSLSCPVLRVSSDYALTNALCSVATTYNANLNPTYVVSCDAAMTTTASGIIQTHWCDTNGGYLSFTTNFEIPPVQQANVAILQPAASATGVDKCRDAAPSPCAVLGPSSVSMPAGTSYTFSVALQCPCQSVSTHWSATFGTCNVKTSYKNVNPTYTVDVPAGSEGRGGSILTEWCDRDGRYKNFTTNFQVAGTPTNPEAQNSAEVGVMSQGSNNAQFQNNTNWRRYPWVIFLFCLLCILVCIFFLLLIRLLWKRKEAHQNYGDVGAQRRASNPNTNDFAPMQPYAGQQRSSLSYETNPPGTINPSGTTNQGYA